MDVTEEVVRNIAELVQLKVDDADIQQLTKGMQNILALADQMQAIDTDGIEPVSNPLDASQKLRPDAITEGNQRELFQSIAPATEAGLYLVPRVVE
ncbi:MAG: Asp-tRNA(Asn)/Glu-tRNA(Gln) amidotransferase subunit GatC [Pseudomonadales bacterium]